MLKQLKQAPFVSVPIYLFIRPVSGGGKTLMKDKVEYTLPLGLAGRLAHVWIVERQLKDIFTYRVSRINECARN